VRDLDGLVTISRPTTRGNQVLGMRTPAACGAQTSTFFEKRERAAGQGPRLFPGASTGLKSRLARSSRSDLRNN
jgi:hypothetical protein